MENLVSRDAYDVDETGYGKRMPIVGGLYMAISFALIFGVVFPLVVDRNMSLFMALFAGLGSGILAGLLFLPLLRIRIRRRGRARTDALYADNSNIAVSPPADREFSHRLVCNWIKSKNRAVGGVLYIGRDSLMFLPHKQNLPQQEPFEIAPLSDAKFSIVEPQLNLLLRTLTERPPRYIEVKWFGGNALFYAPEAEQTLTKIKNIIETKQLERGEPIAEVFDEKDLTPLEKVFRERK
ncbi:MAG: hypothetical protein M3033_02670 [Acidobacteriota bacterium]|nr:hypothetical protein [Acidobacteriota bacterium]